MNIPVGKSANAFKLRPLTLLAPLDDERLLGTELLTTLPGIEQHMWELAILPNAMLEAIPDVTLLRLKFAHCSMQLMKNLQEQTRMLQEVEELVAMKLPRALEG